MKIFLCFVCIIGMLACNGSKKQLEVSNSTDTGALAKKYNLEKIKLPKGFVIDVYAEVPNARSMSLSPAGILYVGNRSGDKVYAVTDDNKDGRAEKVYTIASGLNTPNGVAFKNGNLYIATISEILKLEDIENKLANPPAPKIVFNKYPTDKHHGWKYISFGPDGKLYVPVGAPCNICKKDDPVYSSITRINEDGSGMEVFANGIRNSVGFAWHPESKQFWFTENGRDMMGENVPGDELNTAPQAGMHFGFPYCHQGNILDPEFGAGKDCSNYTAPVQVLGPHVAALGMRFYTGSMFGEEYRNRIFIAEHGSWNRTEPLGYRVSQVNLDSSGKSTGCSVFAEGWLQPDGTVLGRPVDVQVMPDGAMLVSDDYAGVIYRISKK